MQSAAEKQEFMLAAIEELKYRHAGEKFFRMFPKTGEFSRDKYPKQWEFFTLEKVKQYTALLGANGAGKSEAGAFSTTMHLTGLYDHFDWPGHRYTKPINNWSAGVDFKSIRESLQLTMVGRRGHEGTGMIPREFVDETRYGPNGVLDYIRVKHQSGGKSQCLIKCYEQGREAFQAANVDDIWLDEEPADATIYSECTQRFRGATKHGRLRMTFTPLFGVSDVVCMFLPTFMNNFNEEEYEQSGRGYVVCTMDDVPHISPEEKARKWANTLPHEREARINGMPSIGEGKIYPFAEDSFVIDPVKGGLPRHWPRLYGMDPGRRCTAAIWGAHDTDTDTLYLYSEHYMQDQLPPVHAQAIKARGHWIPGVIDPASKQRSGLVDDSYFSIYTDPDSKLGLLLREADNRGVNVYEGEGIGIHAVYDRLATGRIKVYRTLTNWLQEFRKYSRDKNQKVIKRDDHLMDATRYLCMGLKHARLPHGDVDRSPKTAEMRFY